MARLTVLQASYDALAQELSECKQGRVADAAGQARAAAEAAAR